MRENTLERRLLVAEDHVVVGEGIVRLLEEHFSDVHLVRSGEELLRALSDGGIDLVIADVSMPDMTGIAALKKLRDAGDSTQFLFLSMHENCSLVASALQAGASGYLAKSSAGEELIHAVRAVLAGKVYLTTTLATRSIIETKSRTLLTKKQQVILNYLAQGLRSKQIAYKLGISLRTVESHKYIMMQQMGVHGTLELVRRAHDVGLITAFRSEIKEGADYEA